jgi:hypothetical protein
MQVADKFLVTVNWADNYYRQEKIIGQIMQEVWILNSSVVAVNSIMNISEDIIRHPQRYYPMVMNREEDLGRGDKQY